MSSPSEEINCKSVSTDTNQFVETSDDLTVEIDVPAITDPDQTDELDLSLMINGPLADTSYDQTAVIVNQQTIEPQDSKFQIHYSLFRETLPVVIVFHCSGKISKANCLILHNTFKICASRNLSFIVFDMSDVTAVEYDVWNYFSSKVLKLQKQNGIVLFSGIRTEVLSETNDFHRLNICHCETIDVCLTVIRNLVLEHEKVAFFPEFTGKEQSSIKSEPEDIETFFKSANNVHQSDPDIVQFQYLKIDDSISTDFSVYKEPARINSESPNKDFSSNNPDNLVNPMSPSITYIRNNFSVNTVSIAQDSIIKDKSTEDLSMNQRLNNNFRNVATESPFSDINQAHNVKILSIEDKIDLIIAQNGPCSFGRIKKLLNSDNFGPVKIGSLQLMKVLKEMNLDSDKKRIRHYRSC